MLIFFYMFDTYWSTYMLCYEVFIEAVYRMCVSELIDSLAKHSVH